MQQVQMVDGLVSDREHDGVAIPPLTHAEAFGLGAEEMRQFLNLLDTLEGGDWDQPTACTLWSVRDIVAHQAAHVTSFTGIGAFLAQLKPSLTRPYRAQGMNMLDAINQSQVDLRRERSPRELIDELRSAAKRSMRGRDRIPALVRAPKLRMPGFDQPRSLGYLFDLIYTRDMWMHRHDISSATGRAMTLNARHDGRIVELVVLDLAEKARRDFPNRSALLRLTGPAGGGYRIGAPGSPAATVTVDALDFCVLTSGRNAATDVVQRGLVTMAGDHELAESMVAYFENRVLY